MNNCDGKFSMSRNNKTRHLCATYGKWTFSHLMGTVIIVVAGLGGYDKEMVPVAIQFGVVRRRHLNNDDKVLNMIKVPKSSLNQMKPNQMK